MDISRYTGYDFFTILSIRVGSDQLLRRKIHRIIIDNLSGKTLSQFTANNGAKLKSIGMSDDDVTLILPDLLDVQNNGYQFRFDRVPAGTTWAMHCDRTLGKVVYVDYQEFSSENVQKKPKDDGFLTAMNVLNVEKEQVTYATSAIFEGTTGTMESILAKQDTLWSTGKVEKKLDASVSRLEKEDIDANSLVSSFFLLMTDH